MLDPDAPRDSPEPHDPFLDVEGFMHCADRVVTYGFVRKATGKGRKQHIMQYRGTKRHANVVCDESSGDITTIYTDPGNDWAECATWTP